MQEVPLLQQGQTSAYRRWAGHLWDLSIFPEAEVTRRSWGLRLPSSPGAQVMVQQSWRPPPEDSKAVGHWQQEPG